MMGACAAGPRRCVIAFWGLAQLYEAPVLLDRQRRAQTQANPDFDAHDSAA
jgi:hypothetical protein